MANCSLIRKLESEFYEIRYPNVNVRFLDRFKKTKLAICINKTNTFLIPLSDVGSLNFNYKADGDRFKVQLGDWEYIADTEYEAKDILLAIGRRLAPSKRRRIFKIATITLLLLILVNSVDGLSPRDHSPDNFERQKTLLESNQELSLTKLNAPEVSQANTAIENPVTAPAANVLSDVGLDDPLHPN